MSAEEGEEPAGADDKVASGLVDLADMIIVLTDDFHMLADLAEQAALVLPLLAPAGEVVFETRLVLAAIVVIVAVEARDLTIAPAAIIWVEELAIVVASSQ